MKKKLKNQKPFFEKPQKTTDHGGHGGVKVDIRSDTCYNVFWVFWSIFGFMVFGH